jgi:hypothetical protein
MFMKWHLGRGKFNIKMEDQKVTDYALHCRRTRLS